jgi:hypothetical protein
MLTAYAAVQAFKSQAEALAPNGNLAPEAIAELKGQAQKMGLSDDKASKIIRGVTNKRLIGSMQNLQQQGQLTLNKVGSVTSCTLQYRTHEMRMRSHVVLQIYASCGRLCMLHWLCCSARACTSRQLRAKLHRSVIAQESESHVMRAGARAR